VREVVLDASVAIKWFAERPSVVRRRPVPQHIFDAD